MSLVLRALLIVCAVVVLLFVLRKLKKNQMKALDSVFWLFFSCAFVLFGLFPGAVAKVSSALGFQSASNCVFLFVIAVLVIRDFTSSIRIASLSNKVDLLATEIALREHDVEGGASGEGC